MITSSRNIYIYWCGQEYNLISILRDLIDLHSKNGRGYTLNIISDKNIKQYEISNGFKLLIFYLLKEVKY